MTSLRDYGALDPDPPRLRPDYVVETKQPDSARVAGHVGPVPARGGRGFLGWRYADQHRIRTLHSETGGAYALSDDVLAHLRTANVTVVLIGETDTQAVYEWPLAAFDSPVPNRILETDREGAIIDPQTYAPVEAAEEWADHTYDVVLHDRADD